LRITGYKDLLFGSGFYYIEAAFVSLKPNIQRKIKFMVDTGSQITTISFKDSLPFYENVPPPTNFTLGAGASIPTSVLFNCSLGFDLI
jgi:hypothetical protein